MIIGMRRKTRSLQNNIHVYKIIVCYIYLSMIKSFIIKINLDQWLHESYSPWSFHTDIDYKIYIIVNINFATTSCNNCSYIIYIYKYIVRLEEKLNSWVERKKKVVVILLLQFLFIFILFSVKLRETKISTHCMYCKIYKKFFTEWYMYSCKFIITVCTSQLTRVPLMYFYIRLL